MKKAVDEMVWPQTDYTRIIHENVRETFHQSPMVAFTYGQLLEQLTKNLSWLALDTDQRKQVLHKVVNTGIKKYIQLGLVKEIKSELSVAKQWIWSQFVDKTSYRNLTTSTEVASSEEAIRECLNRAISNKKLKELNEEAKAVNAQ